MSADMNNRVMTPEQEHEFYADPANQEPQGPARRRKGPLSTPVPVRPCVGSTIGWANGFYCRFAR